MIEAVGFLLGLIALYAVACQYMVKRMVKACYLELDDVQTYLDEIDAWLDEEEE